MTRGLEGGRYRPLSDDHVGRIHDKALRILEEIGVRVELPAARAAFAAAGAAVDGDAAMVRLPSRLVETRLAMAPARVLLYGRAPGNDLILERYRVYMGTGGAALNVIDPASGQRRPGALADIARLARLADTLENIHFFVRPCTARDVPAATLGLAEFYAALANTGKHVMGSAGSVEDVRRVMGLASLVAGSRRRLRQKPFISFIVSFLKSPLVFDREPTAVLMEVVRQGMPVALSAAPMAGATSPLTMAGTLCQLHAEEMAGIVFTQLLRPGAPVLYGGIPGMADMRDLSYRAGGVEFGLMNAAISQLATYIDVPNYCSAGITEAGQPCFQAVYEKTFSIAQCALAGANYIHHAAGVLESIRTVDYGQMVIDNEIIGMALKMLQGITVNEETLAFSEIREVGPGGMFVDTAHTMKYLRSEYLESKLTGRHLARSGRDREHYTYLDLLAESRARALDIVGRPPREWLAPETARSIERRFRLAAAGVRVEECP